MKYSNKIITTVAGTLLISGSAMASIADDHTEAGWSSENMSENYSGEQVSYSGTPLSAEELNDNGFNWSSESLSSNFQEVRYTFDDFLEESGFNF
ncbi:MAG: hypothetical protein H8D24_02245 [Gammaproteobacteria bacterium]|uniref:Uncharacterized protein n=1 Tax=Candidatus Thiopontia autotrophica TaxID=2841688 RepID=A0A8J6NYN6_9GAMM|nr:hypothetical protein [Candidatus Thiopontia autotrophica]MBL6969179.1 hypothetical protein [Gammaproteobacteria bacterium]